MRRTQAASEITWTRPLEISVGFFTGIEESCLHLEILQVHRQSAPHVYRYALSLIKDRELARDATQEGFLRYYLARIRGEQIREPKGWLFRVARNYLIDYLRESSRRNETGIDEARNVSAHEENPEALLQRKETWSRLLDSLAPRELECLHLRAAGLRYREIAEVLRIRCGTVGALMARMAEKARAVSR
jgi:RNA polymerase sigma-70 factor (ECF subfamily)